MPFDTNEQARLLLLAIHEAPPLAHVKIATLFLDVAKAAGAVELVDRQIARLQVEIAPLMDPPIRTC
jgi:hypothetical protein